MPRAAAPFLSPAFAQGARRGWPGVRRKGEEQKVVDEGRGGLNPLRGPLAALTAPESNGIAGVEGQHA